MKQGSVGCGQVIAVPPPHVPFWQVSPVTQRLPVLHVPLFFATAAGHPLEGLQAPIVWHWSVVQLIALPPMHVPF